VSILFVFILMIFGHIVDDYYLQGWLASAKQKQWWKDNAPDKLYRFDYIWALVMHSFSWSFMIMLPCVIALDFNVGVCYVFFLVLNTLLHALIDNAKANLKVINLWVDQLCHMVQIIGTFCLFVGGGF
jgi:hypothetical protein